jgi:uncharacterized membrane protein
MLKSRYSRMAGIGAIPDFGCLAEYGVLPMQAVAAGGTLRTTMPTDRGPAAQPESRLPPLVALLVATALPLLMPDPLLPGPRWLVPVVIFSLTAVLVVDAWRTGRRSRRVRRLQIGIAIVLAASTAYATVALAAALAIGSAAITNSADELLRAGGVVWVALLVTFAFLYWELDLGGPEVRAASERRCPDLAFPQDLDPEIARPGWRPTFIDYLYLGVTNNMAFSPTDVMPLSHHAKLAMSLQSVASLLIIGLVIARAVNIFR